MKLTTLIVLIFFPGNAGSQYIQNYEQALLLSNAVVSEIQEQIIDIESTLPEGQKPKSYNGEAEAKTHHPVSFLSGKISDKLIARMADYLYSLLQGTGEVIKPTRPTTTTTTTTTTTVPPTSSTSTPPELRPFRDENLIDLAILRQEVSILDQTEQPINNIRRKPLPKLLRKMGVSHRKSDKLWKKSRRRRVSGRV